MSPKFSISLFARHLNDSRFIDDSSVPVAFFNNTNDPSRVTLLSFDFLAVGSSLFSRQANQKASRSFRCVALKESEHVSARFSHCSHLGDYRQIVNDKGDIIFLVLRKVLSVTEDTIPSNIGGTVSVEPVHETSSDTIQSTHRVDGAKVSTANIFICNNQLDFVPFVDTFAVKAN